MAIYTYEDSCRLAYALRLRGAGITEIINILTADGYPTATGKGSWWGPNTRRTIALGAAMQPPPDGPKGKGQGQAKGNPGKGAKRSEAKSKGAPIATVESIEHAQLIREIRALSKQSTGVLRRIGLDRHAEIPERPLAAQILLAARE